VRALVPLTLLCTVASLPALVASAAPKPQNVLLVSIDSLRADRVGVYGNPRLTSPTLDRLANEGIRFAHASSPTSWTLPAHATLLSGRAQRSHQVITTADRLPPSVTLLPEVFARHGYETAGFYSGPFLHPAYGFGRGFERYVSCEGARTAHLDGEAAWENSHGDRTNGRIAEAFTAWLGARSARPFFAFVHMWDVHYDYIPPEPYASMFDPGYDGPLDGRDIAGRGFPLDAGPRDVRHLLALYDGEVRWTDATLARLLGALEDAGLLEHTLVVVTADHGEEFLEHGGKGHQRTLYDEVLHVPLVLWSERGLPSHLTISAPVSLTDVAPTILDLAGLPPLPDADGQSLVPMLHGDASGARPVFAALYNPRVGRLKLASVQAGRRKLIHASAGDTWQEFDLIADPGETHPLPVHDERLRAALAAYAAEARNALARRPDAGRRTTPADLPRQVREHLRALGYVE
jgi:arylsulfatase A-like enzyme